MDIFHSRGIVVDIQNPDLHIPENAAYLYIVPVFLDENGNVEEIFNGPGSLVPQRDLFIDHLAYKT